MASKVAIVLDSSKQLSPAPFSSSSSSLIAILLLLFSLFCACCSSLPCNLKLSLLADHYKSVVHDLTEQIDPPSRDHNGRATTTENPFFFFFKKKKKNVFQLLFYSLFPVRNFLDSILISSQPWQSTLDNRFQNSPVRISHRLLRIHSQTVLYRTGVRKYSL